MEDTALIALVIIVCCFIALFIGLLKYGIDGSLKVWGVVGTAVGAIVSYYFTDQANHQEVRQLQTEYTLAQEAFTEALDTAEKFETQYLQLASELKRSELSRPGSPQVNLLLERNNEEITASSKKLERLDNLRGKILLPGTSQ